MLGGEDIAKKPEAVVEAFEGFGQHLIAARALNPAVEIVSPDVGDDEASQKADEGDGEKAGGETEDKPD